MTELKPCPFCGGEVREVVPSWNIANAACKSCGAEWGYCGSGYDGRFEKWNKRFETPDVREKSE